VNKERAAVAASQAFIAVFAGGSGRYSLVVLTNGGAKDRGPGSAILVLVPRSALVNILTPAGAIAEMKRAAEAALASA
jgi:hypothetical protein